VGVSMTHAENLVQDILGNFQCELSKPYLFYRNKGVVNGIWFFEPSECEAIAQLVQVRVRVRVRVRVQLVQVSAMLLRSTFPVLRYESAQAEQSADIPVFLFCRPRELNVGLGNRVVQRGVHNAKSTFVGG